MGAALPYTVLVVLPCVRCMHMFDVPVLFFSSSSFLPFSTPTWSAKQTFGQSSCWCRQPAPLLRYLKTWQRRRRPASCSSWRSRWETGSRRWMQRGTTCSPCWPSSSRSPREHSASSAASIHKQPVRIVRSPKPPARTVNKQHRMNRASPVLLVKPLKILSHSL